MTLAQQIITVAVLVVGTASTRFLPFLLFHGKETPASVRYLGLVLPSAVFGMLVVYCLKDVDFTGGFYGLPEFIGIAVTAAMHYWKRQMLLSILVGTVSYMALVQTVFA